VIIEWNQHIFHPDTTRFPLHERAVYRPDVSKNPDDPLAAYMAHMQKEGIDRAILVHPEPYGDDHRLILDCLEREPDRFFGTSLFYPKDEDAPSRLVDLVALQPKIISTRFHAHRGKEQYLDSFAEQGVRALWAKAVEFELVVELHIGPNYAAQVVDVLRDFPQTAVLIDHLAEPHMGDPVEFFDVLELAQFDNAYMKLSGLSHFKKDAPLYESARSFTKRVIAEFGVARVVWGAGTPGIVDAHMIEYSEEDRALVKGGNLQRLLPWIT
jgi:predicted TIM-barrel fold metal-dependent hydrolase